MVILPTSLAQTKPAKPTFTLEVSDGDVYLNITNQPFTPYTDNGSEINLYYEAYIKKQGAVDSSWTTTNTPPFHYVIQTDSQYTKLYVGTQFNQNLDVKVRAVVGTIIHLPYDPDSPFSARYEFKGVEGDWSDTQIVPLNRPAPSSTASFPVTFPPVNTSPANPNPSTPNQPDTNNSGLFGFVSWVGVVVVVLLCVVVVVLLAVIAVVLWRKNVSQFNNTLNTSATEG
jgi:hypothetical protein